MIRKIGAELASDGWEDPAGKGHILMQHVSKDARERIVISVGMRRSDRAIAIDPFVGIRYEPVAALVEMPHQDGQIEAALMPTVRVALADVCAESSYKSWVFDEIDSSEEAVRAVLRALRSEGYRYMRHTHDQGSIRLALE